MNIRKRFTIWYVQRGYTFECTDSAFECPFWVKPLLIFFSPSVYVHIVYDNFIYTNLVKGLTNVRMEKFFNYDFGEEIAQYPPVDHDEHDNDSMHERRK